MTRKRMQLSLRAIAYHEAGHAVVAHYFRIHIKGCSIEPDEDSGGRVHHSGRIGGDPGAFKTDRMRMGAERQAMVALAGLEAQRRYRPSSARNWHASFEHQNAADLLYRFVFSDEELKFWFKLLEVRTRALVSSHVLWPAIQGFAVVLMEKRRLSGRESRDAISAIFMDSSRWTRASTDAGPVTA